MINNGIHGGGCGAGTGGGGCGTGGGGGCGCGPGGAMYIETPTTVVIALPDMRRPTYNPESPMPAKLQGKVDPSVWQGLVAAYCDAAGPYVAAMEAMSRAAGRATVMLVVAFFCIPASVAVLIAVWFVLGVALLTVSIVFFFGTMIAMCCIGGGPLASNVHATEAAYAGAVSQIASDYAPAFAEAGMMLENKGTVVTTISTSSSMGSGSSMNNNRVHVHHQAHYWLQISGIPLLPAGSGMLPPPAAPQAKQEPSAEPPPAYQYPTTTSTA